MVQEALPEVNICNGISVTVFMLLLTQWLQKCVDKVTSLGIFDDQHIPNHVLINEYRPGQGIMVG